MWFEDSDRDRAPVSKHAIQGGGSTPGTGFDASGLVQYAYGQAAIALPRVAYDPFSSGPGRARNLRVGDLVFFYDGPGSVGHVGIYTGAGKFVHAPIQAW